MLLIIYTILAWIATPYALEFVNTQTGVDDRIRTVIHGWPAYATNVVICALVAFVITLLPKGWPFSWSGWFLLTCVIYFGNQFFFNTLIKPLLAHRRAKTNGS